LDNYSTEDVLIKLPKIIAGQSTSATPKLWQEPNFPPAKKKATGNSSNF
jgi:hypothetical protein